MNLHIVPAAEGDVLGHDLGDLQRAAHDGGGFGDFGRALDAVWLARRGRGAPLPRAAVVPAIDLIFAQRRDLQPIQRVSGCVQQQNRLAGGGEAEGRVVRAVGCAVVAVGQHHDALARRQRAAGEGEGPGGLGFAHQRAARQCGGRVGYVLDFDPVRPAVRAGQRRGRVGAHAQRGFGAIAVQTGEMGDTGNENRREAENGEDQNLFRRDAALGALLFSGSLLCHG